MCRPVISGTPLWQNSVYFAERFLVDSFYAVRTGYSHKTGFPEIMITLRSQILTSRVMEDLKKRSTIGIAFYLVAACTVIFADGYYGRHTAFANGYLGLMTGVCLFRLVHMSIDRRLPQNRTNRTVFVCSVIATALIWGLGYGWFTWQEAEPSTQILMVVCTVGLCSGGVVAFIPNLWLSLGFNFCIMLPGVYAHMALSPNIPLGLLFILFFIYMIFMALRQNKEYWTALDNEALLEEKTRQLKRLSNRDGLTGLYNRRYFDKAFSYEWKRALRKPEPVSVVICDVDYFKKVNDQYGHLAGDEFLKRIAGHLQAVFKRETDIVARYGGEEFVVLVPGEPLESVRGQAERVRQTVEQDTLVFEGHTITATISLGLACCVPEPDMARQVLLADADRALYMAKNQGRNRICTVSTQSQ